MAILNRIVWEWNGYKKVMFQKEGELLEEGQSMKNKDIHLTCDTYTHTHTYTYKITHTHKHTHKLTF